MSFKELLQPVDDFYWDERGVFQYKAKIRGVIVSLLFALVVWIIASHIVGVVVFGLYEGWIRLANGHWVNLSTRAARIDIYVLCLIPGMMIEGLMRLTPMVAFMTCRSWPSLVKCFVFSLLAPRANSGSYSLAPPNVSK